MRDKEYVKVGMMSPGTHRTDVIVNGKLKHVTTKVDKYGNIVSQTITDAFLGIF